MKAKVFLIIGVMCVLAIMPSNRFAAVAQDDAAEGANGATAIAAGGESTCALTADGGVKCWGWNRSGQLGDGTRLDRSTPVDVVALGSEAQAIAVGGWHTCALTVGGGVKCWGSGGSGQLGDGGGGIPCGSEITDICRLTPVNVVGLTEGGKAIAAGGIHTCALMEGGGVKCWGHNWYGQTGDGTTDGVTGDGFFHARLMPVDVVGLGSEVHAISAGLYHTCALTAEGGVKCWGLNRDGQLGDGGGGQLCGWENERICRLSPVDVVGLVTGIKTIVAGDGHTCALTMEGGVKCWGQNWYGQLGNGTQTDSPTPVDVVGLETGVQALAAGEKFTCAVAADGGVKCWGLNDGGQLGDGTSGDGLFHARLTPVDVLGLGSGVRVVSSGFSHTCAITVGGGVKCWGVNGVGQLGDGGGGTLCVVGIKCQVTPIDVVGFGGSEQKYTTVAEAIAGLEAASSAQLRDIYQAASSVSLAADYFLDAQDIHEAQRVVNLALNLNEVLTLGVTWSQVGRGVEHIARPGYQAALNASWRGWVSEDTARHWYKPLYDVFHNNRQVLTDKMLDAGLNYYGKDIILTLGPDWALRSFIPGTSNPYQDIIGTQAVQLGVGYQAELRREHDEMILLLNGLTLTTSLQNAYLDDMQSRQMANAAVVGQLLDHRDLIWHNYEDALADENDWVQIWGPTLGKWAVVGTATLFWDGPGFYIASLGTNAVTTVYQFSADSRALSQDEAMLLHAEGFLTGRTSQALGFVAHNTVGAYNLIRARNLPQIARGEISQSIMFSGGHYRTWPTLWWAEERCQVESTIVNSGTSDATYITSATYNYASLWNGDDRFQVEGQAVHLSPSLARTAVIPLKLEEWGECPKLESNITVLVLGMTETGIYHVAEFDMKWTPVRVELMTAQAAEAAKEYTQAEAESAPAYPYPLTSYVVGETKSTDHMLVIAAYNPFTFTLNASVSQPIPEGFEVTDTAGAEVTGDTLRWSKTLEAGTGQEWHVRLAWEAEPGESLALPGPTLVLQDPATQTGDSYTVATQNVESVWPIEILSDIPTAWQFGTTTNLTVTVKNISASLAAEGLLTVTVSTLGGEVLWQEPQSFEVASGASLAIKFSVPVPVAVDEIILSSQANIGAIEHGIFFEVVAVDSGEVIYLPKVQSASEPNIILNDDIE